ncbi:MAG: aminotransferase class IV [Alistipes sp.]
MTEAYLYQTVHTLGGRPLYLSEHIAVLDRASRALFGRPFALDATLLTSQITTLLTTHQAPTSCSVFVQIRSFFSGDVQLLLAGKSLYYGYDLRSLHPEALTMRYELPFGDYPTSARKALAALAHTQAERHHVQSVVRFDATGVVNTCDDAPLFGVAGDKLYTSPAPPSVEGRVAATCIAAAKFELVVQPILHEQLALFDELFYFDHRGITSLARCDGNPLMSIVTERVAHEATLLSAL